MQSLIDVVVPDIGDFKDVEVIEVLVKPGDTVKPEQSLITVECDKASMEIPSSAGGAVKELRSSSATRSRRAARFSLLEPAGAPAQRRRAGRARGRPGRQRWRLRPQRRAPSAPAAAGAGSGQGRRRMRRARARRRTRRLLGCVPRGGPGPEDGAGRALCDARRRLPECRLHPIQGAAACGRGHGRGGALRRRSAWPSVRRSSTSASCARTRTRSSAS